MSRKEGSHSSESRKYCCEHVSFSHREDYKRLRTNIRFCLSADSPCSVIGVTSAQPTDGKSLTAINLAYSFAQIPDKRVLLIDCDMRRPSVAAKLGFTQAPGLSNLVSGVDDGKDGEVKNVYKPSDGSRSFDVLTCGRIPPNPSELLASDRMKRLIAQIRTAYDFVLLDLPPVGAVTDAQVASELTDGMLIVVRESGCARPVLDECLHQLTLANARILGFILNGSVETTRAGYRYKKYSRYGTGYGSNYGYGYGSSNNGYGGNNSYGGYYGNYYPSTTAPAASNASPQGTRYPNPSAQSASASQYPDPSAQSNQTYSTGTVSHSDNTGSASSEARHSRFHL